MRRNEKAFDGTEILKARGGRDFYFHGRHFHISDLYEKDRKDGEKYLIDEIDKNGFLNVLHNSIGWDVPHFKTISSARRFVADWEHFLKPLD